MWCIVFPKSPPFLGLLCDLMYKVVSSVINFSKTKNLSQSLRWPWLFSKALQVSSDYFPLFHKLIIRLYEDIRWNSVCFLLMAKAELLEKDFS